MNLNNRTLVHSNIEELREKSHIDKTSFQQIRNKPCIK